MGCVRVWQCRTRGVSPLLPICSERCDSWAGQSVRYTVVITLLACVLPYGLLLVSYNTLASFLSAFVWGESVLILIQLKRQVLRSTHGDDD